METQEKYTEVIMKEFEDQEEYDERVEKMRRNLVLFLNAHEEKDAYITISALTHALLELVYGIPNQDNKKRVVASIIHNINLTSSYSDNSPNETKH